MKGKLRRFLLLERPRKTGATEHPDCARFSLLEREHGVPSLGNASTHLSRFDGSDEQPLELDRTRAPDASFSRCAQGELENKRDVLRYSRNTSMAKVFLNHLESTRARQVTVGAMAIVPLLGFWVHPLVGILLALMALLLWVPFAEKKD